jgi:hypothetical protein
VTARDNPYAAYTDATGYNPFLDSSPIDQDGLIDLLSLLAGADFRKPDPVVLMAWSVAATQERWTKGAAFRAAARHIATSTEFAKPAHLTALMKLERDTVPDHRLALPSAPPASEDARAAAKAAFQDVSARLPQVRNIGRLPWSQQTRRPRATQDDAELRARVVADLEARRQQAAELERRRVAGEFLRGPGVG